MKCRLPLLFLLVTGFACSQDEPLGLQDEIRNAPVSAQLPPGIPPRAGGPAELDLVKSASPSTGTVAAGDSIAFDIRLTNSGKGIAVRAWLTDILPDVGSSWTVAHTGGAEVLCLFIGTTLACGQFAPSPDGGTDFVGITLRPKEFYSLRVSALTDEGDCGTVTNTATAVAARSPEVSDTASITVVCPPQPELEIVKTGFPDDRTVGPGDPFGYDITVTNNGPGTATRVFLTDNLPAAFFTTNYTAEQTAGDVSVHCEGGGSTLLCGIFASGPGGTDFVGVDMDPGQTYTVRITSPNDQGECGIATNTASVTADNASEVSDSGSVTVICPPQ
jgi:uncharacterized repeat protein (TIGR01451 family)